MSKFSDQTGKGGAKKEVVFCCLNLSYFGYELPLRGEFF